MMIWFAYLLNILELLLPIKYSLQQKMVTNLEFVKNILVITDTLGEEYREKLGNKSSNAYKKKSTSMRNDTRAILQDYYKPYNRKLAQMMEDDQYLWQD